MLFAKNSLCGAWYSDWAYRKVITNNLAVGGDLTNFPLLIVISNDADLNTYASNNGHDIFFTLVTNTNKLSHEIEYFNAGTLVAWVKIPLFSASEQASNVLYMYFDKNKTGNQQNKTDVWSESYAAVWHFNESAGATAITDSSPNSVNSTTRYGVPTAGVTGKIGTAFDFPQPAESGGLTNYFYFGYPAALSNCTNNQTLEIWLNQDSFAARQNPWGKAYAGEFAWTTELSGDLNYYFGITGSNSGTSSVHYSSTGTLGTGEHQLNVWDYWSSVRDFTNNSIIWYSNGILNRTSTPWTNWCKAGNGAFYIGRGYISSTNFCGMLDEARISYIARSPNWLSTTYANMNNPTSYRTLGTTETFPGVNFTLLTFSTALTIIDETVGLMIVANVLTGTITSINITWGDGQINIFTPGVTNVSETFIHEYTARNNFTVTAVVTASSGMAATNSTVISTLPYRFYNPYNLSFYNESKGCLIKWNITSSANITHFNLYRGSDLHARIENPSLREYLDERIIFGDYHSYWLEAVYPAGSVFSSTNTSACHAVYKREALLGTGGGNLDTLIAGLYAPPDAFSSTCMVTINILSNNYASFYESGKPVYHQVEIAGDTEGKIRGGLVLKFRIPVTNGSLSFKPANANGYTAEAHKDKLFCALWDGKTWTPLSTAVYENRLQNNFSFLELETSVNRLGIYGILYNARGMSGDTPLTVKNRVFLPGLDDPARSSVQISFPNPEREQVKIQVFDMNGKIVKENGFNEWINFWSWNGLDNSGKLSGPGLYIISIVVGGKRADAHNAHVYLLK